MSRPRPQPWNPVAWIRLVLLFAAELARSVAAVSGAVLRPRLGIRPAILAVPLDLRGAAGVTLLADLVTLTPGTTALHVSEDRRTLYVHAMDAPDPAAAVARIKSGFERAILRVLR